MSNLFPFEPLDISRTLASRNKAWTVKELADILNMSQTGIYSAVKRGSIPARKVGTATRFDPKAVSDWWETSCKAA